MKYKIEYSQIVRRKMQSLKAYLTEQFDSDVAVKGISTITKAVRKLEKFPDSGVALSKHYDVDTDFRYLYVNHNYLFYYLEGNRIIIAEMFDEREDFMYKLFGISSISEESEDFWGE